MEASTLVCFKLVINHKVTDVARDKITQELLGTATTWRKRNDRRRVIAHDTQTTGRRLQNEQARYIVFSESFLADAI